MDQPVASTTVIGIRPNGERLEIVLAIGQPYLVSDGDGLEQWRCPVSLAPLHRRLADACGADAVQAMSLGLSLLYRLLAHFREDGGRLLHDDGTDWPLDAYTFSARDPNPPPPTVA